MGVEDSTPVSCHDCEQLQFFCFVLFFKDSLANALIPFLEKKKQKRLFVVTQSLKEHPFGQRESAPGRIVPEHLNAPPPGSMQPKSGYPDGGWPLSMGAEWTGSALEGKISAKQVLL